MADPITIGLAVASTALSAMGQIQQGQAAEVNAKARAQQLEAQAKQQEINAGQERAIGQRQARESRREAELKSSRVQALTAAGGGGSFDPSVVNLLSDLAAEGEYNYQSDIFEGEDRARDLEYGATLDRYQADNERRAGKAAKRAGYLSAATTVLKGGTSIAGRFGGENFAQTGQGSGYDPSVSAPSRKPVGYR